MLPEVKAFIAEMEALNAPKLTDLPIEEMRGAFAISAKMFDADGPHVAHVSDHAVPGPAGDIAVRLYDPAPGTTTPTQAVVYYHGGGFLVGTLDSHDGFCRRIAAKLRMPVLAVDYRLAPEHIFPAAIEDSVAATRWAAVHLSTVLGRDVIGLITCGDSAGGNLATVVPLELPVTGGAPIVLQVLLYPVTDCARQYPSEVTNGKGMLLETEGMEMFIKGYCPDESQREDPRLSPMFAQDVGALPPAIVVVAELDPLHDEGLAYAEKLKAAGVSVTVRAEAGIVHGFYTMTKAFPTGLKMTDEMLSLVNNTLA